MIVCYVTQMKTRSRFTPIITHVYFCVYVITKIKLQFLYHLTKIFDLIDLSRFQITLHFIIVLAAILSTARAGSYQYIRFSTGSKKSSSSLRASKSFGFSSGDTFIHQSHSFDDIFETPHTFSFEESKGHISPDFSNGLGLKNAKKKFFFNFISNFLLNVMFNVVKKEILTQSFKATKRKISLVCAFCNISHIGGLFVKAFVNVVLYLF